MLLFTVFGLHWAVHERTEHPWASPKAPWVSPGAPLVCLGAPLGLPCDSGPGLLWHPLGAPGAYARNVPVGLALASLWKLVWWVKTEVNLSALKHASLLLDPICEPDGLGLPHTRLIDHF